MALTIKSLLEHTAQRLAASRKQNFGLTPRLDAEVLLSKVLDCSRLDLIAGSDQFVSENARVLLDQMVERRLSGEPVAYITAEKEFYGINFLITPDVLVPRPETEMLVDLALLFAARPNRPKLRILDLGCGSGCIGLSLMHELSEKGKEAQLLGVDISEAAVSAASSNAEKLNLNSRCHFLVSNWFAALDAAGGKFDIIVSNPPYVGENDEVSHEVYHEPTMAVFSSSDGLGDIEAIIGRVADYIESPAVFLCEIGFKQGLAVLKIVEKKLASRCRSQIIKDLSGLDRVLRLDFD